MNYFQMLLIVCPLIFLSSFIDSIAGGGGLISLPAYMLAGLPGHMAFGCNKFSASMGTFVSTVRYYKNGKIHLKTAAVSGILSLVGAACGAKLNLFIDADLLKTVCVFLIPAVAVIVLFGNKWVRPKEKIDETLKLYLFCAVIGFFVGMYDGLIGPGTGTFFIIAFTLIGFDHVMASGNAKVGNLASNVASLVVYLLAGEVYFKLAVPATVCSIAGGYLGSGMAIQKGSKFIRVILVLVLVGIFAKLVYDLGMM